ncbi:hypothetical protein FKM82_003396 [Ascaphus truei]
MTSTLCRPDIPASCHRCSLRVKSVPHSMVIDATLQGLLPSPAACVLRALSKTSEVLAMSESCKGLLGECNRTVGFLSSGNYQALNCMTFLKLQ